MYVHGAIMGTGWEVILWRAGRSRLWLNVLLL